MKISFLEIVGFRGVKDKIRIDFPAGFVVICGRNGSGKSTLCDAVEYALRGKIDKTYLSESEKGETVSDYIWWRGKERALDHYVTLGLQDTEGNELILKRGPEGLISPSKNENVDNVLCFADRAPDGCVDHLCRASIIRDEMITNLSVDMPESERFKFVKTAVTTSNFEIIEERAKKIKEVLSNKADALKQQYEQARNRINALLTERSKLQAEAQQATDISNAEYNLRLLANKPIEEISSVISTARNLLGTARMQVEVLTRQIEPLKELIIRRLKIETSEFKKQLTDLQDKIREVERRVSAEQERNNQLSRQIEEQEQLQPRLVSLAEIASHGKNIGLIDGSCPLCGLHVAESDYIRHIEELLRSLQEREKVMTKLVNDRVQCSSNIRNLNNELSREKIALDNMSRASEYVIAQLKRITEEIANYGLDCESEMLLTPELLENAITSRRRQMSELEKHIAVLEASTAIEKAISLERDISVARKAALDCEKQLERLERAKSRADRLYSTLRRIAGEIVDEQLAALSPLFSELYIRLRPHIDWQDVKYHIRGDVRRFLSLRVGDALNLRFMFSSGQRRATGLAFLLAVNQSLGWSKFKTLILDDPVQHIDDYRALHLTELLASIRLSKQQIICTVEDSALADLLCRRLRSSESEEGVLINMEYSTGEGAKVISQQKIYPTIREVLLSA